MASFAAVVRSHNVILSTPIQRTRSTLGLFQNLPWNRPQAVISNRHLYAAAAIGLDAYVYNRDRVAAQFKNLHDRFRERMGQVVESESQNMIFTEDLKNAAHLAEPTEEDISLVIRMSKKFNKQNSGLRFGDYVFGPVVMRMFHHLNQPEAALQALKTEELEGFFDQLSSYQIAMDLLYKNERYQDALDVFCDVQEKRLNGVKYPRNCVTIALAACFKMNTNESYEKMKEILEGAQEYGININLRCIMFAAALALKQNFPHICLELLSRANTQTLVAIRNMRIMALTELGRVEDTLPVLRAVLHFDVPEKHHFAAGDASKFLRESIQKIEQAVRATGNKELISEFEYVSKNLKENNYISEKTLDEFVCHQIEPVKPNSRHQDRAMLAASFNRNSRNQRHGQRNDYRRRPGLMERE